MTSPLEVHFTMGSHAGVVRQGNEDSVGALGLVLGRRDDAVEQTVARLSPTPAICALSDGAGGHPSGDTASRLVVEAALGWKGEASGSEALSEIAMAADEAIVRESALRPERAGMGATIALLVVTEDSVLHANVGDSRIYEVTGEQLIQLSVDDNPPPLPWDPDHGRSSVLLQMIGAAPATGFDVHSSRLAVEPGLRFLMCSDGLTDVLDDDSILELIRSAAEDADAVKALLDAAVQGGAPDNVTVALAAVREVEEPLSVSDAPDAGSVGWDGQQTDGAEPTGVESSLAETEAPRSFGGFTEGESEVGGIKPLTRDGEDAPK